MAFKDRLLEFFGVASTAGAQASAGSPERKSLIVELDETFRRSGILFDSSVLPVTAIRDGYKKNAVVFACVSALGFAFPETTPTMLDRSTNLPIIDHDLARSLAGESGDDLLSPEDLALFEIVYMALTGVCYLHKLRSQSGRVVGFKPYHRGQMEPVAVGSRWVDHYRYIGASRQVISSGTDRIDPNDIIPLRWPTPDPDCPGETVAPLKVIANEYGSDNEMTRYLDDLMRNDAVPRTLLMVDKDTLAYDKANATLASEAFESKYGPGNRGKVAVLPPGMTVERLGLDLSELAFDALRKVPEARITAAFRVPAILAGVTAGLDKSTYANFAQARKSFTEQTLVPLWRRVAATKTRSLQRDFPGDWYLWHDLTDVQALQEDQSRRVANLRATSIQIQGMQRDVTTGVLSREQAIANATLVLEIPSEQAARLFP